jgi:hypothetical protein
MLMKLLLKGRLSKDWLMLSAAVVLSCTTTAQTPNDANSASASGSTMAASRLAGTPVNNFTGIPSISVPVYNYSHPSGIGLGISLDYFAGGIKLNEKSSTVGLGWNLSAGGAVIRSVRGIPDDFPIKGFLYSAAVPNNYPSMGALYFSDSIDAEQDVFQVSAPGLSYRFFIGKNRQIVTAPLSKVKITYSTTSPDTSRITSFTVTTTSGVKYVFNEMEQTKDSTGFQSCYTGINYTTAWHLGQIIAPFNTDTIKLNYQTVNEYKVETPFNHSVNVKANGTYDPVSKPVGSQSIILKKLSSIVFPDNKSVTFLYDLAITYDGQDQVLSRIKINDSIFRYGYLLDRDSISPAFPRGHCFLTGVRYYTSTFVNPGYKFAYNIKYDPKPRSGANTFNNRRDHWGFYNGYNNNAHAIPTTTGPFGTFTGANRNPVDTLTGANTLSSVTDANGAVTHYKFEPNDYYEPWIATPQSVTFNGKISTNNTISIAHASNNKDSFTVSIAAYTRVAGGIDPVSGNIIFSITNPDSTVTYTSQTISLDTLYLKGYIGFSCTNLPNSNVVFKSRLATGAVINPYVFNLTASWDKYAANAQNKTTAGGIRIKHILQYDPFLNKTDTVTSYRYVMPDGKSSGFAGGAAVYTHPYQELKYQGTNLTTTAYTSIISDPVNNLSYANGNPVGYKRVEVIRGTPTRNLGKQVFEYSDTSGVTNVEGDVFPYPPVIQKSWAVGLPKRTLVYDSLGNLKQLTTNTYSIQNQNYTNDNFRSCRLGKTAKYVDENTGEYDETYLGAFYYAASGRSDLISSTDTFYHVNGSVTTSKRDIEYDANYNPIKTISPYDKTRGLNVENRIYYPYNYTLGGVIGKLRDSSIYVPVSSESWITGDASPRILSGQITEFQQLPKGYIRPLSTYALQAVSPVPQATIGTFNAASLVRNSTYFIKQQNFTAYDNISNMLETQSHQSKVYNTVIMDHDNRQAVAQVSNAKFADVAYTSFEADGKGNWTFSSNARENIGVTGVKSYNLSNGSITKSGLTPGVTYIITYWKRVAGTVSVTNAQNLTFLIAQNGWSLNTLTISGQTSVTVSGTAIIDELRLYPKDANMVSSQYDPAKGLLSACDAGNTVTYQEYDNFNRLKIVRDRNNYILKKYDYPNNITAISTAPNWVSTGITVCAPTLGGVVNMIQKDTNPYSENYNTTREIQHSTGCVACNSTCTYYKFYKRPVNCACQNASTVYTSSNWVYVFSESSGQYIWTWECVYYLQWTDGISVGPFYEYNSSPCTEL